MLALVDVLGAANARDNALKMVFTKPVGTVPSGCLNENDQPGPFLSDVIHSLIALVRFPRTDTLLRGITIGSPVGVPFNGRHWTLHGEARSSYEHQESSYMIWLDSDGGTLPIFIQGACIVAVEAEEEVEDGQRERLSQTFEANQMQLPGVLW